MANMETEKFNNMGVSDTISAIATSGPEMQVYIHLCVWAHMRMCVFVCVCAYVYVGACTCAFVCIVYVCVYVSL